MWFNCLECYGLTDSRQSGDDRDEPSIKEMLRALLKKLDKAADADVTGDIQPRAYNVSQIQHHYKYKNSRNMAVNRVSLPLIIQIACEVQQLGVVVGLCLP